MLVLDLCTACIDVNLHVHAGGTLIILVVFWLCKCWTIYTLLLKNLHIILFD